MNHGSRPAAAAESSDEDSGDEMTRLMVDPKVALQMADLGNDARDRQTAHDLERDRQIDFAQINRLRKCNHEGSEEASMAAANRSQISGWNSFGGDDSTTNLTDIAGGQYHRLATAQKVQAEVRQLRIEGKELNAESIDQPRGRQIRRGTGGSTIRGSGRKQYPDIPNNSKRPLDPAVDPNRAYKYKTGPKYADDPKKSVRGQGSSRGGRGGRGSGRGDHTVQLDRGSMMNIHAAPASATPSLDTKCEGLGARATRQRHLQERPWPPAALVDNPPVGNKTTDEKSVREHTNVAEVRRSVRPQKFSASDTQPSTALDKPKLADNFGDWFKAAYIQPAEADPMVVSTSQPNANSDAVEELVRAPREELSHEEGGRAEISEDHRTDGRLSPVSLSAALEGQSSPKTITHPTRGLLDVEISDQEKVALDRLSDAINAHKSVFDTSNDSAQSKPASYKTGSEQPRVATASPLQRRSANLNVAITKEVDRSKWEAPSQSHSTGKSSEGGLLTCSTATSASASMLGDCSSLRRRAPSASKAILALNQSRYAAVRPMEPTTSQRGIKRTAPGPGYDMLLRHLAEQNISVNDTRRPDEPAFTQGPQIAAFTQYRDLSDAATPDNDSEL